MRTHPIIWAILIVLSGAAGPAKADPLNVTDFDSLGEFPSRPGIYAINTSGDPRLTAPDGTVIGGVVFNDLAVFTFDAIVIGTDMTITAGGDRPLALLSYSDAIIHGTGIINVSGQTVQGLSAGSGGPGGDGGGNGGSAGQAGAPGGGPGGGSGGNLTTPGGGGGGFGGAGGGPNGGSAYGDLTVFLEGGSGGGGGFGGAHAGARGGGGGGGGGTIEIGALGDIIIAGDSIQAMGGSGGLPFRAGSGSGGGGSGGGIFLHGDSVVLLSLLKATGGNGGSGGGGGQVLILTGAGGFWDEAGIDVSGGTGPAGDGEPGTVTIMGMGILGALALADLARRRWTLGLQSVPRHPRDFS
jgi:hypothetical protein